MEAAIKRPLEEEEEDCTEDNNIAELELENENDFDKLQEERIANVSAIYVPISSIDGITNSLVACRLGDDESFVLQMAKDDYLFDTVKWMFDKARDHIEWEFEPHKQSTIRSVVRELERRTDYCMHVANEVKLNQFSLKTICEAHGEVQSFMLMLEPFVLKEEEKGRDDLIQSHHQDITILYEKVKRAHAIIIEKREMMEKDNSQQETVKRPPSRHGRESSKHHVAASKENEKLPARPVTRDGRD